MSSRRTHSLCVIAASLLMVSFQMPQGDVQEEPAVIGQVEVLDAEQLRWVTGHLEENAGSLSREEIDETARVLVREAAARGFAPGLVLAVIEIESRFDAFAVSRVGAIGLMQLMPATGAYLAERHGIDWHGERTLFDPAANVLLGVAYLEELRDRFDELATALAAYNYGPSAIGRRVRRGAPVPARYAQAVLAAWERSAREAGSAS
jgi:soluble lytic murein transglycosylase-like protein